MDSKKVFIGLLVIVLGIALLLANFGFVDFNVLSRLWNLWPLLLILIGVNIIFKEKPMVSYISWILFFIIVIVYGVFIHNNYFPIENIGENIQLEMEKPSQTQYGYLSLDIGAARLKIDKEDNHLLLADINGRPLNYKEDYQDNNQRAIISFENVNFHRRHMVNAKSSNYDFYLNKETIWDLYLGLGAISGQINLEDIPVQSIDLDLGAGSLDIILGHKAPKLNFKIDAGASDIGIVIPEDAGIKVKMDGGLTSTNIDQLGFNKEGDYYISSNYENAGTQIDFDIDMGLGKINFESQ